MLVMIMMMIVKAMMIIIIFVLIMKVINTHKHQDIASSNLSDTSYTSPIVHHPSVLAPSHTLVVD